LAERGTAVVFTSHDMEEVAKLSDTVVMIDHGRVRAIGTPTELCARHGAPDLDHLYLSLTEEAL
jgi:ABC-2 type transport system ATP-binding protein